jgi:hypothetical protein
LPTSKIGLEILTGKDTTLDFEDFLGGPEQQPKLIDVHASAEVHRLGWKKAL